MGDLNHEAEVTGNEYGMNECCWSLDLVNKLHTPSFMKGDIVDYWPF